MRDRYLTPATTHALARHADFLDAAGAARRLAAVPPVRAARPHPAAGLRRAIAGLGARRATPSLTTTAPAAT